MDLIWDGRRLIVAGPDRTARWYETSAGAEFIGLRFSAGLGPALLQVAADDVADRSLDLDELWATSVVRKLTEQVADDPEAQLERWLIARARGSRLDPLGPRVQAMAAAGWSVATMAEEATMGARQLHRRCLSLFGYGPRRLARILRLGRALDVARAGMPWADVAAGCGYADQAHLARESRALTGATPSALLES
jgi:AraC-like DNA-binding protein